MRVEFDFFAVWTQWPLLAKGVFNTLWLTAAAVIIGVALAAVLAWARSGARYGAPGWLSPPVAAYVEAIRNTPFIVQLFFIFFGLPSLGVKLSPEVASVLAMVINLSAYATEILRAGVDATPRGQLEAAASLGLTRVQCYRRVVLPPAFAKVWPALVSQIVIVMLGSSVCSQISTEELSFAANLIQSRNFRAFEAFITAAAVYLLLSIGLRALLNWIGPRFLFGQRRVAAARAPAAPAKVQHG